MEDFARTFKEVKNTKPSSLRGIAREIALNGLSLKTMMPMYSRILTKSRVQFLYIHHVFDDELSSFEKLIELLSKNHTFISYSDAVNKILDDDIDKPYISISSDDGFRNNLKAAEILDRYDIKACFFVNPDTIGLKDFSSIKSFCKKRLHFPPMQFLDWDDVNDLMKRGHEIGSHTIGHINIADTPLSEVEYNINESRRLLMEKCGNVHHFAYPYGRYFHFNLRAFDMVFQAGFSSCASAERGCHIAPRKKLRPNELFIRRDHVICDWNVNHVLYFVLESAIRSNISMNYIPYND